MCNSKVWSASLKNGCMDLYCHFTITVKVPTFNVQLEIAGLLVHTALTGLKVGFSTTGPFYPHLQLKV